jgi:hypothetical protein
MDEEHVMMENGKSRRRRQLSPEVGDLSGPRFAGESPRPTQPGSMGVDVSVIIRLRALANGCRARGVRLSEAGSAGVDRRVELELLRAKNDRLSEPIKELAVELTLHRGRQRSGFSARSDRA